MLKEQTTISNNKIKIADLLDSSWYAVPRYIDKKILFKLSIHTTIFIFEMYRYFSSSTGKKIGKKEFTIKQMREFVSVDGELISRNTLTKILNQIKEHNLLLINEGVIDGTSVKVFTFYLPNDKNKDMFTNAENNKGYFINKVKNMYYENNIIELPKKESNDISHEKEAIVTPEINHCHGHDNDILTTTIDTTCVDSVLTSPKDIWYKENLYKESPISPSLKNKKKEEGVNLNLESLTSEQQKILDELKNLGVKKNMEVVLKFPIDYIQKHISYHDYREFKDKNGYGLYQALLNDTPPTEEWKRQFELNQVAEFNRKYQSVLTLLKLPSCSYSDKILNITKSLIAKLDDAGLLETNSSTMNNENRFKRTDEKTSEVCSLLNEIINITSPGGLLQTMQKGLEMIVKFPAYSPLDSKIKRLVKDRGVNIHTIEKALIKMQILKR